MTDTDARPRFTGHESFACRFTWLPKAVRLIEQDDRALASDDEAILALGLGKNMVRSLRFWLDAFDVARCNDGAWKLQPFGAALLGCDGLDPFIERTATQWLLQWAVTSRAAGPLYAWRHVFYRTTRTDFTRSELLADLRRDSAAEGYAHSDATLIQHADVLLHTYDGTTIPGAPEDVLDSPLVDLKLIVGGTRRRNREGRNEPVFSLARVPLAAVGDRVVRYAVEDFWEKRRLGEQQVSFRDLAYAEGAPGATFRITEEDLREHLEQADGGYTFKASGDTGAAVRLEPTDVARRLREVFA